MLNIPYLYPVEQTPDSKILIDIVRTPMPYGKYKGTLIADIAAHYLEWMSSQGFPPGKLGMLISTAFEIKTNGLGEILFKVKKLVKPR